MWKNPNDENSIMLNILATKANKYVDQTIAVRRTSICHGSEYAYVYLMIREYVINMKK